MRRGLEIATDSSVAIAAVLHSRTLLLQNGLEEIFLFFFTTPCPTKKIILQWLSKLNEGEIRAALPNIFGCIWVNDYTKSHLIEKASIHSARAMEPNPGSIAWPGVVGPRHAYLTSWIFRITCTTLRRFGNLRGWERDLIVGPKTERGTMMICRVRKSITQMAPCQVMPRLKPW